MRLKKTRKPECIVGIDPGDVESAIGIVWIDGELKTSRFEKIPNPEVRKYLDGMLSEAINFHVAMEEIVCYGGSVGRTIFTTVEWIGRYKEFMELRDIPYTMLKRKTIVTEICGNPKATDANIREEMVYLYGEPGTKKKPGPTHGIVKDMWSALAIATTYGAQRRWISI